MPRFHEMTPCQATALRGHIADGHSANKIRVTMKISQKILDRWLLELGLELARNYVFKNKLAPSASEVAEFRHYYAAVPSQRAILRRYNISKKTLREWLESLGIDPHPPHARGQKTRAAENALPRERAPNIAPSSSREGREGSIAARFRPLGLVKLSPYR